MTNLEDALATVWNDVRTLPRARARAIVEKYIASVPEGIEKLRHDSGLPLEGSPTSLVALWEWAKPQLVGRSVPDSERLEVPEFIRRSVNAIGLTRDSAKLVNCIAMYFGQSFAEHVDGRWGMFEGGKTAADNHCPAIFRGKQWTVRPTILVTTAALRHVHDSPHVLSLMDLWEIWCRDMGVPERADPGGAAP